MKKYLLTIATLALFAIGFAASDEEENSSKSSSESSAPKTEQRQETEAESQAREQKEKAERQAKEKNEKKKELLEHARYWANTFSSSMGADCSRGYRDGKCKERFLDMIPNPSTDEDFELYKEFKKVWDEEWDKVQAAKQRMDNM